MGQVMSVRGPNRKADTHSDPDQTACRHCGSFGPQATFQQCAQCQTYYCDRVCLNRDWLDHKLVCESHVGK